MNERRRNVPAIALKDGRIVVLGGEDKIGETNQLSSIEYTLVDKIGHDGINKFLNEERVKNIVTVTNNTKRTLYIYSDKAKEYNMISYEDGGKFVKIEPYLKMPMKALYKVNCHKSKTFQITLSDNDGTHVDDKIINIPQNVIKKTLILKSKVSPKFPNRIVSLNVSEGNDGEERLNIKELPDIYKKSNIDYFKASIESAVWADVKKKS